MSKKRLFILSQAMELGGAERSLLGLLDALKESEYEVDSIMYPLPMKKVSMR